MQRRDWLVAFIGWALFAWTVWYRRRGRNASPAEFRERPC